MNKKYIAAALELAIVLLITQIAFVWGKCTALLERGYTAYGGEYLFLLIPFSYYITKQIAIDWIAEIRKRRGTESMGKQYRTCPWCGDRLDPGEQCDCQSRVTVDSETARIIRMPLPRRDVPAQSARAEAPPPTPYKSVRGQPHGKNDCYTAVIVTPPKQKIKSHRNNIKGGF